MPFEEGKKDGQVRLRILESLSIYDVAALRDALLACLEGDNEVIVDLGGVEQCDMAGLQILHSLRKTAAQMKKKVQILDEKGVVLEALEAAGINTEDIMSHGNAA